MTTPKVARAIYVAIGDKLVVEDRGRAWVVYPFPAHLDPTVIVAGGGELTMEIDKCTASIVTGRNK